MEKLTDAEVVKALECCMDNNKGCEECPFRHSQGRCTENMLTNALDLINRKDAEIYVLNEALDGETVKNMRLKHEVERLKAEIRNTDNALVSLDRPLIEVKNEAYKELATTTILGISKLPFQKNKGDVDAEIGYKDCALDACHLIDNLLKELTEGKREDSN